MTKLIKNLLEGANSVFLVNPPPRRVPIKKHYNPHKSIEAAIHSDWQKIGGDFNKAIKRAVDGEG